MEATIILILLVIGALIFVLPIVALEIGRAHV